MKTRKTLFACGVFLAFLFLLPAFALSQAPYYQGKTITIINGNPPGGTGPMRMNALLPYLRKYIPGNPNIVAEFMPGGGGRKVANHIYRVAAPDGLTIGNPPGGFIASAVLGEPGVNYDLDKLIYLGSPNSATHYVFLTRKEVGLNNMEKLRSYSGLRIGAQSVGHTIYIVERLFAYLMSLRDPKFVVGYSGPEVDLALLQGEIDSRANIADTIFQRVPEWIDKGMVDFHAILEIPRGHHHPRFAQLPELESFVKSDRERRMLAMFRTLRLAGSPYILPPGTARDRVEILRAAMRKSFQDPDFPKDYRKLAGDDPSPLIGEEQEKVMREIPREPGVIDLFKKIAGGGPLPAR